MSMSQPLFLLHLSMDVADLMKKLLKLNSELKIFLLIIKNSNLLNGNTTNRDQMAAIAIARFSLILLTTIKL